MAGDLNLREQVVIEGSGAAAAAAMRAADDADSSVVAIHRYGRVAVVADVGDEPTAAFAAVAAPTRAATTDLTDLERAGLEAFQLRESPEYIESKLNRPRQGEPWDMPGCALAPVAPPGAPARGEAGAPAPGPTSAYLEGSVAVGVVIVEGPNADLKFSAAEQTKVVAEVQNGLSFYATSNPAANITFTYDVHTVSLTTAPDPGATDLEAVWRNPAMAALGFTADWAGVGSYVESLRTNFHTQWTYCVFFTKYPLGHFGYANIGGPRIVMDYAQDGWGPDNIDRVFAHETGHIFNCPDEYAASGCACGGVWGRFGGPNDNCENCAPGGGVVCLMKGNTFAFCNYTPTHLGWTRGGVPANPVLLQGRFGGQGNFELVYPAAGSGFNFMWRNNDDAAMPWSSPVLVGQASGRIDALTMIQSNYGDPGNLELIARAGDKLHFYWRDSGPDFAWGGPFEIASGAAGNPALIQGRFGGQGNFELVYPAVGDGINFMWRNNDDPAMPWSPPFTFGQASGHVDGLTLIQSNYGDPGNLELIARAGDKLHFYWRDSGPDFAWGGPFEIASGAAGNPALIQGRFGGQGNFELVYPAVGDGINFMWRNNDDPAMPWSPPFTFGQASGHVDALTLIQSNYGSPGNLELIARVGDKIHFYWRDSGPDFAWNGPFTL